jgi:soluble lytic murein transglycosylase-like protein
MKEVAPTSPNIPVQVSRSPTAPPASPRRAIRKKPGTPKTPEELAGQIESATNRWLPLIRKACDRHGIPQHERLVQAIMYHESRGKPNARGLNKDKSGRVTSVDQGLMQLNSRYYKNPNIMDPEININTGVGAIAANLKKYNGDIYKVMAAYNCGNATRIPDSTKNKYIPGVTRNLEALNQVDSASA